MRTWGQLSEAEQALVLKDQLDQILCAVVAGAIKFDDDKNDDSMQAKIDAALEEAEANQTPWFAGEAIYETCKEELDEFVLYHCSQAIYVEPSELVIQLPLIADEEGADDNNGAGSAEVG